MVGLRACVWLLIGVCLQVALVCGAAANSPSDSLTDDGRLTLLGKVLLPDGTPAAGAKVRVGGRAEAVTDAAGEFELRDLLSGIVYLHAESADETLQAATRISPVSARKDLARPLQLQLAPAQTREVIVVAGEEPVEGAQVTARARGVTAMSATNAEGKATVYLPADYPISDITAWHEEIGIEGATTQDNESSDGIQRLALRPSAPLAVRFIDPEGQPVANVRFIANVLVQSNGESRWIVARNETASAMQSDRNGEYVIAWMPREDVQYVEMNVVESDWKVDEIENDRLADRQITVRVRRLETVHARAVVPADSTCEGVLVMGFGFGSDTRGDIAYARLRSDGTFTLRMPSDHGYVLGTLDEEWASNLWSGVPVASNGRTAQSIELRVEPAIPLTVRVTRGADQQPVVNAAVEISRSGEVQFVDGAGKQQIGNTGPRAWVYTDANGLARLGVDQGEVSVRLAHDDWQETRTIEVDSREPIDVKFHRPWIGTRQIAGRLLRDGKLWSPPSDLMVRTWVDRYRDEVSKVVPDVHADGSFTVDFEAEKVALLFIDEQTGLSGFAKLGDQETAVDVVMQPMAIYRGTLVDGSAKPIAGRTLSARIDETGEKFSLAQPTDQAGRFEFARVPCDVPVTISLDEAIGGSDERLPRERCLFLPGEVREGVRLVARSNSPAPSAPIAVRPLPERVAGSCQYTGTSHMYTLAVCKGDRSKEVERFVDAIVDDEFEPIIPYLPLIVEAGQLRAEKVHAANLGWPLPAAGQVALVAIDRSEQVVASVVIDTGTSHAQAAAREFLTQSGPPVLDAQALLVDARSAAQASGRRVWLVLGGPRCGPCFRLAAWMDDHRELLAKDYVIVKVIGGLDNHVVEALGNLPYRRHGIPWHCVTEPDGTLLITSEGPLGNIGMPATIEEMRHLRQMLEETSQSLSADEISALVESIGPND